MNYVTVNYVTTILLKSKYLSRCMHYLKKIFVFNQSKSVPVNKDQFRPYYSNCCHFILTRIYLYALGSPTLLRCVVIRSHNKHISLSETSHGWTINLNYCHFFDGSALVNTLPSQSQRTLGEHATLDVLPKVQPI